MKVTTPQHTLTRACQAEGPQCAARLPVTIENISRCPLRITELRIVTAGWANRSFYWHLVRRSPWSVTLQPGQRVLHTLLLDAPGRYSVWLGFKGGQGTVRNWNPELQSIDVYAAAHRSAIAACQKCRGHFGQHGITGTLGCICATTDGDKVCLDGNDCQSECVFQRVRIVATPQGKRGLLEGRCAASRTVFGCHRFVPRGARSAGPRPLPLAPPGQTCLD